jgi:hypothetical protein
MNARMYARIAYSDRKEADQEADGVTGIALCAAAV